MFGARARVGRRDMGIESTRCEVFTYVVVMRGGDGRTTLPVTVCARPDEAEHAARVIAWLELTVLGGPPHDPDLYE
jgi:hypothetical protein